MTHYLSFAVLGRRHQLTQNQQVKENYLLEELTKIIEEKARMRLQQLHQRQQKHPAPQEITGPGFSFMLPPMTKAEFNKDSDEPIQFAVEPFDSRYYETKFDEDTADEIDDSSNTLSENGNESDLPADGKSKILIPPPMHVHHHGSGTSDKILHRAQMKQAKMQQTTPDVMQKPLQVEFDNTMSLYIVALIAGLSCAFSTGVSRKLIAQ